MELHKGVINFTQDERSDEVGQLDGRGLNIRWLRSWTRPGRTKTVGEIKGATDRRYLPAARRRISADFLFISLGIIMSVARAWWANFLPPRRPPLDGNQTSVNEESKRIFNYCVWIFLTRPGSYKNFNDDDRLWLSLFLSNLVYI